MALIKLYIANVISTGNSMVSSAIWKKHARVRFSKTIINNIHDKSAIGGGQDAEIRHWGRYSHH